jgi:hypothetical protein
MAPILPTFHFTPELSSYGATLTVIACLTSFAAA